MEGWAIAFFLHGCAKVGGRRGTSRDGSVCPASSRAGRARPRDLSRGSPVSGEDGFGWRRGALGLRMHECFGEIPRPSARLGMTRFECRAFSGSRSRLAFGVRRSAFGVWRSAFGVRRSAFGVRRSAFGVCDADDSAFTTCHPEPAKRGRGISRGLLRCRSRTAWAGVAGAPGLRLHECFGEIPRPSARLGMTRSSFARV